MILKTKKNRASKYDVAVFGAGIAGMKAALSAAEFGHRVVLLEKDNSPGGSMRRFGLFLGYLGDESLAAAQEALAELRDLIGLVRKHPRMRLLTNAEVLSVDGEFGAFKTRFLHKGRTRVLSAGALVVATGRARRAVRAPDCRQQNGRMISLTDLAGHFQAKTQIPRRVAILLDAELEHDLALGAAAWGAAEMLASRRGAFVKVYCRNVQVAATGLDALYRRARAGGAITIKFDDPPIVKQSAEAVTIETGGIKDEFDWVVATGGIVAGTEIAITGLRPGPNGFVQSNNVWMLPVATNLLGIAVAGSARGASEWRESLKDGDAAALLVHEWLCGAGIMPRDDAARVDANVCVLCLTCKRTCPRGAISIDEAKKAVKISALSCMRCGVCASVCPARAIELPHYTDAQLAGEPRPDAKVTVFACENSAYQAAMMQSGGICSNIRLVRVPCIGRVDATQVLSAFENGASRVCVLGCHREACSYLTGADHCAVRVSALRDALARAGFDPAALALGHMTAFDGTAFGEFVRV